MEYKRIGDCGMRLASQGEYRKAVDLFLKAVLKAPAKDATMRYYFFIFYTTILIHELHGEASPREMEILHNEFLNNPNEPSYFRITASHCIGNCIMIGGANANDHDDDEKKQRREGVAADIYRKGLLLAKSTTKEEREMLVDSGDETNGGGKLPASFFIGTAVASIRENLNDIVNPLRVLEVVQEDPIPSSSSRSSKKKRMSSRRSLQKVRSPKQDFITRNDLILASPTPTPSVTKRRGGGETTRKLQRPLLQPIKKTGLEQD